MCERWIIGESWLAVNQDQFIDIDICVCFEIGVTHA